MDTEDKIKLVVLLLAAFVAGLIESRGRWCDEKEAIRAAEIQGFSDVKVMAHHYWFVGLQGCDQKDAAKFDIVAKNASGKPVSFYVCTGFMFKGATIRSN